MARYKTVFELKGTEQQQAIIREALDAIKFPFERLTFPKGFAVIGWANLNGQTSISENPLAVEGELEVKIISPTDETPRGHEGDHPAKDTDTEPLTGEINGRKYTLGVFYPSTGNIYVDNALVNYPEYAKTTVSAEVAHSVDEFLPLSSAQRQEIIKLVHDNDPDPSNRLNDHVDSWWEMYDYGVEYYSLIGESFMIMFTYAYSDMPFEGATAFYHEGTPALASDIRRIVGIERTDYVAPAPIEEPITPVPEPPAEIPVEPTPEPTPSEPTPVEPTPVPEPEPDKEGDGSPSPDSGDSGGGATDVPDTPVQESFVKYGKSKVYHIPDHYEKKKNGVAVSGEQLANLKLCKVCAKLMAKAAK